MSVGCVPYLTRYHRKGCRKSRDREISPLACRSDLGGKRLFAFRGIDLHARDTLSPATTAPTSGDLSVLARRACNFASRGPARRPDRIRREVTRGPPIIPTTPQSGGVPTSVETARNYFDIIATSIQVNREILGNDNDHLPRHERAFEPAPRCTRLHVVDATRSRRHLDSPFAWHAYDTVNHQPSANKRSVPEWTNRPTNVCGAYGGGEKPAEPAYRDVIYSVNAC